MERRGRIPVAKFRTSEGKARSRSRARERPLNDPSLELDSFTLLEENIALKEEIKNLKGTIENQQDNLKKLQDNNAILCKKVENLVDESKERSRVQLKELNLNSLERKQNIFSEDYNKEFCISPTTKKLLMQIKHEIKADTSNTDIERLINLCKNNNRSNGKNTPNDVDYDDDDDDDEEDMSPLNCIQKLLTEFSNLKININNLELQLYEANEKISDLLENQNHLEQENKHLKEKLSTVNLLPKKEVVKETNKPELQEAPKHEDLQDNYFPSSKMEKESMEFSRPVTISKNVLPQSLDDDVQERKSNKISVNIDETKLITKMTTKEDEISVKNKMMGKQSSSAAVQSSDRIVEMVLTL